MSIELCEKMLDKYELFMELEKGLNSIKKGQFCLAKDVYKEVYDIINESKKKY